MKRSAMPRIPGPELRRSRCGPHGSKYPISCIRARLQGHGSAPCKWGLLLHTLIRDSTIPLFFSSVERNKRGSFSIPALQNPLRGLRRAKSEGAEAPCRLQNAPQKCAIVPGAPTCCSTGLPGCHGDQDTKGPCGNTRQELFHRDLLSAAPHRDPLVIFTLVFSGCDCDRERGVRVPTSLQLRLPRKAGNPAPESHRRPVAALRGPGLLEGPALARSLCVGQA